MTALASEAPTPDTAGSSFHHRLQRWRAPGIIFPFRISKAAAGLFWSGNLILRVGFILAPWRTLSAAPDPRPRPTCCRPPLSSPRGAAQRTPAPGLGPKWIPRPSLRTRRAGTGGRPPETRSRGPGKVGSYKKASALRTQWARGWERTWHQASSDAAQPLRPTASPTLTGDTPHANTRTLSLSHTHSSITTTPTATPTAAHMGACTRHSSTDKHARTHS